MSAIAASGLLVGLLAAPGALATHNSEASSPCAGVQPLPPPPNVYADPQCVTEEGDDKDPFHVDPRIEQELSVHVAWTYDAPEDTAEVKTFLILRGSVPTAMYPIAQVDAHEPWEFEDDWQWAGNGAVWYAVAANHADGETVMSDAYLIRPTVW